MILLQGRQEMNIDKHPTITVITCTFNSEQFLEKALRSVENQTYPHIEHIINDSFSTDSTMRILQDYIDRNSTRYPIKLIHSDPHGVGNALNIALEHATGEIVHFLHSDDYYLDNHSLERAANVFIENPDLKWLTGNFLLEWKGRKIVLPQTLILKPNLEIALSIMNFISHENTFVKTEAVRSYGGFMETKDEPVEYKLWLRLFKDHSPMIVNDEFAVFIIHKGSTSTGNIFKLMKAFRRAYRTQNREHILPLLGYYQDKRGYKWYKVFVNKIIEFSRKVRLIFLRTLV